VKNVFIIAYWLSVTMFFIVLSIGIYNTNDSDIEEQKPAVPEVTKPTPRVNTIKIKKLNLDPTQIVFLNVGIERASVDYTIKALDLAASVNDHVYLVLDSPGGSVVDGAKLINYVKYSDVTIDTVCDGMCASMAFHIHQVGKKRLMTNKSILMAHPASSGMQGTLEQMGNLLRTLTLYVDRLDFDVAKRVGIPFDKFKERVATEMWIESQDALSENFCDGIVFLPNSSNFGENLSIKEQLKKDGITVKTVGPRTNGFSEAR